MKFSKILFYLIIIVAALFLMAGYGYQWGLWELSIGFTVLRWSAYASVAIFVISLIGFYFVKDSGFGPKALLVIVLLISGIASGTALYWQQVGGSVPAIHDITTDIQNPPQFVAMVRLRADAPNPPEYAGEESAEAQREAYPDIQPLELSADLQQVMDEAVTLIVGRRWDLVAINRNEGRIEATEKLAWFGFKDDVVLRFTESENGTRVDMRSKSRIGRSDLGVNAKRIERFLDDLQDQFE